MSEVNAMNEANEALDLDQLSHNREEVDLLYRIYLEKRIAAQVSFYESRMRENQLNADFTFTVGALVMTLSSLVATISASGAAPILSLVSAILPAFAALLGSFRQLYGWERQSNIYRDSLLGLERVKLLAPDDDRLPAADLLGIYPKLVSNSETVFTGEVNQWGQFILDKDKQGEAGDSTDARTMDTLVGDLELSDEQRAIIAAILSGGKKKPAGASSLPAQTVTVSKLTSGAVASQAVSEVVPFDDLPAGEVVAIDDSAAGEVVMMDNSAAGEVVAIDDSAAGEIVMMDNSAAGEVVAMDDSAAGEVVMMDNSAASEVVSPDDHDQFPAG